MRGSLARLGIGFFPMPNFTFEVWISGLVAFVLLLLTLAPLAFCSNKGLRLVAFVLAILMFFNGMGHIAGSIYRQQWMPVAFSAPLLLAMSVWLWLSLNRLRNGNGVGRHSEGGR